MPRSTDENREPLGDHPDMQERQAARVSVKGTSWGVESALARTLAHGLGESVVVRIHDPVDYDEGDIVVTTDSATSPSEVSELAEKGAQVVVLAALPNDIAEAGYRRAGARVYLPMLVAAAPLVTAVAGLITSLAEAL